MIELIFYYLPFRAYRYYDQDLNRALGVVLGILVIYYFPIIIYLTHYTDCFYFIERPGQYHRHHPTTLLLGIPFIFVIWIFFKINKHNILKKFAKYELEHEILKNKKRKSIIVLITITFLYLVISFSLMEFHIIPSIKDCWQD
jgi:hypothetical protein